MSDTNELRARLLAHAARIDAVPSSHSAEQAQWARDLREAAELIAAPTAPEAGPQQELPYGFESGLVQLLNEARCLSKETVGNRELAGRIVRYMRMRGPTPAPAVERGVTFDQVITALKRAMGDALLPAPYRADLIGHFCNHLNAALTATGAAQGDEIKAPPAVWEAVQHALEAKPQQEAPAAQPLTDAARDVLAERQRQIEVEGWTPEHDDEHVNDEIAAMAAFYAMPPGAREWSAEDTGYGDTFGEAIIPEGWAAKEGDRRRELIKAGALILAEIERLDRAKESQP